MLQKMARFQIILLVLVAFFSPFAGEKNCSPNHITHKNFHEAHSHFHAHATKHHNHNCCQGLSTKTNTIHHCETFQLEDNVAIACQQRLKDCHFFLSNQVSDVLEFTQVVLKNSFNITLASNSLTSSSSQASHLSTIVLLI
jgi:hypothetical protein